MTSATRNTLRLVAPLGIPLFGLMALLAIRSTVEAATPTLTAYSANVAVGGTTSIPIILSEAPNGISGFDITVSLSNANVASINEADFPGMALSQYTQVSASEVRLRAADLGGSIESGAANVTLVTLTLQGLKRGTTEIQVSIGSLDDDFGSQITADAASGALSVKKASGGGGSGGKGGGRGKK